MKLNAFVRYLRDALNRFQVEQERAQVDDDSFSMWWRRLHHHVRTERPKTVETAARSDSDGLPVATAVGDVEDFKAALPTRPRGKRP